MNLIIANQAINQHNGLFSLNDLHKVSGGADKHRPSFFLRNAETKELIAEIENSNCANLHSLKNKQIAVITIEGKKGGTFVCRELVIRYAMWISPKFSLMVIRAFDAMNTGAMPCLESPKLSDEQCYQIQKAIKQKCLHNGVHYQTLYNALYDKFKKKSYKDILASDFERAMAFIVGYEFAPALNVAFIQNILADTAYNNKKAQHEIDGIAHVIKGLLHHIEDVQNRLNHSERCVLALQQRFIVS